MIVRPSVCLSLCLSACECDVDLYWSFSLKFIENNHKKVNLGSSLYMVQRNTDVL